LPWLRERNEKVKTPEECLALVRALPNRAHDKNASNPSAPEQQPQELGRPNKKEYRAEQAAKKAEPRKAE
jgi:hypothetical protein